MLPKESADSLVSDMNHKFERQFESLQDTVLLAQRDIEDLKHGNAAGDRHRSPGTDGPTPAFGRIEHSDLAHIEQKFTLKLSQSIESLGELIKKYVRRQKLITDRLLKVEESVYDENDRVSPGSMYTRNSSRRP